VGSYKQIVDGALLHQIFSFFVELWQCAYILHVHVTDDNQSTAKLFLIIDRIITDEDCDRVWESVVTGIEMMAEEQADD
jgi:hypothetical protein